MSTYTAEIGGASWKQGPICQISTIKAARLWAEEYGTTADWCVVINKSGKKIAEFKRFGDVWTRVTI